MFLQLVIAFFVSNLYKSIQYNNLNTSILIMLTSYTYGIYIIVRLCLKGCTHSAMILCDGAVNIH